MSPVSQENGCIEGDSIALADELLRRLFPICRSLTGDGVRETLSILQEYADLDIKSYPTGTRCYDWTIPDEWNIRDAFIADSKGRRIVDFKDSNLHVVHYSVPVDAEMPFAELGKHLHTLPDLPTAIPYRTTFYERDWGFCLSQRQLDAFDPENSYRVVIDADLAPGSLTFGEKILPGESGEEFLISTYCCHPSMANDNLSGVVLTTLLLRELQARKTRHGYRFVFIPETIGAIAYLSHNESAMKALAGGYVATCCGGPGSFGYKESFRGDVIIDRAARIALRDAGVEYIPYPFVPDGSDERQYSSPGFRIPVGSITKDKYHEYPYYHTSLDNLDFVKAEYLVASLELHLAAINILENNALYRSLNPHGEVQLGRRGLYPQLGGVNKQRAYEDRPDDRTLQASKAQWKEMDLISWLLFLADGEHDLLAIAERTGCPFAELARVARRLEDAGVLEKISKAEK